MRRILIANPKGGSGKSTLATHLASWSAWQGWRTMLGDVDRQQSTRHWLQARPEQFPPVHGWEAQLDGPMRPPKGTEWAILDSPAGLHGKKWAAVLDAVDSVIVPVQASPMDMWASEPFLQALAEAKVVRKGKIRVAVVGMRVNPRTQSARQLASFLQRFDLPCVTHIRDAQLYVQTIARGLTLFDLPTLRYAKEREQWQPLLDWLQAPA
ncbi:AAA family ATPase [Leeia sp.]|uniref:nucleotide-binding protein n=1 Tax=Leeia sp. TaxID=2884678 RepID=UPI0035ADBDDA